MNNADLAILTVVGASAILSLSRGFVREAISLGVYAGASAISLAFYQPMSVSLKGMISSPPLAMLVSFVGLFIVTVILGGMFSRVAVGVVSRTGLSSTDRMLGVLFGTIRGVLIVTLVVFGMGLMKDMTEKPVWQESKLIPYFVTMSNVISNFFPDSSLGSVTSSFGAGTKR